MRGKDSRDKKCEFTEDEIKRISKGFNQFVKDIKKE